MTQKRRVPGIGLTFVRDPGVAMGSLPVVVVLPRNDPACTPSDRGFCNLVCTNVAEALGKIHELLVISPDTALRIGRFRRVTRDLRAYLSVDYIVEVGVRQHGQLLRFAHSLVDARSGERIWSDEVPAAIDALYEFEARVTAHIVAVVAPEIQNAEIERVVRKPPAHPTAYELTLQAVPAIRSLKFARFAESERLLAKARAMAPTFASPFAWSARLRCLRVGQGQAGDRDGVAAEALAMALKAIEHEPRNALALTTAGHMHSFLHRQFDKALELFDRSIEVSRSNPLAYSFSGATLTYIGRAAEARKRAELAIRLSPLDPSMVVMAFCAGLACYGQGDYRAAAQWMRRALADNPRYTAGYKILSAALVGDDRVEEARAAAAELRRLEPEFARSGILTTPINDPALYNVFVKQLRTAGAIDPDVRPRQRPASSSSQS